MPADLFLRRCALDEGQLIRRPHVFHGRLPAGVAYPLRHDVNSVEGVEPSARILRSDLLQVHHEHYLDRLWRGELSSYHRLLVGKYGLRFEAEHKLAVMAAGFEALRHAVRSSGFAFSLTGGMHHAFAGHAEGYCFVNDVAVIIAKGRRELGLRRFLVIDLDAHQGNGTAHIFRNDPDVFTFSMHVRKAGTYPFAHTPQLLRTLRNENLLRSILFNAKLEAQEESAAEALAEHDETILKQYFQSQPQVTQTLANALDIIANDVAELSSVFVPSASRCDLHLPPTMSGRYYVNLLNQNLKSIFTTQPAFDAAIYLCGSDVMEEFGYGLDVLAAREQTLYALLRQMNIPYTVIFAGGYGPEAHAAFRQALLLH